MVTCPYCQQDTAGNHAWNCPMNPVNINNGEWQLNNLIQPKPNYYHVSWLEIAVRISRIIKMWYIRFQLAKR